MGTQGEYDLKDALNRCLPVAKRYGLGDKLDAMTTAINMILTKMDANAGVAASVTATTGGTIQNGDTYTLTVLNPNVPSLVSPGVVIGGAGSNIVTADTLTTVAANLAKLVNASATLKAAQISAKASSSVVTISQSGAIGNTTTITSALKGGANITVTMGNGGVLAAGTGTFGNANVSTYGVPTIASMP